MIGRLASTAHELDAWLHENAGRAYVAILSWGLVASILGSLSLLSHALSRGGSFFRLVVILVFQAALLINQLAQWHDLRERRRRRKAAGQGASPGSGGLASGRRYPGTQVAGPSAEAGRQDGNGL